MHVAELAIAVLHLTKSFQSQNKNAQFRTNSNTFPNRISKIMSGQFSNAVTSTEHVRTCMYAALKSNSGSSLSCIHVHVRSMYVCNAHAYMYMHSYLHRCTYIHVWCTMMHQIKHTSTYRIRGYFYGVKFSQIYTMLFFAKKNFAALPAR